MLRLDQIAGDRRIVGRELARFLERRDRLVELAELLVREAEVRQQHAERRTRVAGRAAELGDRRRERVDDRLVLLPLLERFGERVVAPGLLLFCAISCAPSPRRAGRSPSRRSACDSRYSARASVGARGDRPRCSTSRAFVDVRRGRRRSAAPTRSASSARRCAARAAAPARTRRPRRSSAARARRSRRASAAAADRRRAAPRARRSRRRPRRRRRTPRRAARAVLPARLLVDEIGQQRNRLVVGCRCDVQPRQRRAHVRIGLADRPLERRSRC